MVVNDLMDGVLLGYPALEKLRAVIDCAAGTISRVGMGDTPKGYNEKIRRVIVEGSTRLWARTVNIVLARVCVPHGGTSGRICRVERRDVTYRGGLNVGNSIGQCLKDPNGTSGVFTYVNIANVYTRDIVLAEGAHIADADIFFGGGFNVGRSRRAH